MTSMAKPDSCVILRRQLQKELIPDDQTVPDHKKFIPLAKVVSILLHHTIENVLQCRCPYCSDHRRFSGKHEAGRTASRITAPTRKCRTGSLVLFALLTYIKCPCLINIFLERGITDHELLNDTEIFTTDYVQHEFGLDSDLARRFHWEKYKFTVPELINDGYEEYSENTILPFINERPLARHTESGQMVWEGGFGKVYAFELMDGYEDFPEFPGIRSFARKELNSLRRDVFTSEYRNLRFVKLLQDDHLIKVVKAYKHGDRYNFIFPLAKTNLRHYIREPHTYTQAQPPIIAHPLWQEALGLARGLHRVLVYEAPNDTRGRPMYGYHLDLKPANILVDPSGRLIITDFGLSEFLRPADVTSSRVRGRGGTEAYAPPEIDYEEIILNRKYDIWSLGCIFLEIAAFIVRGEAGVRDLDRARILTTPGTFNTDDRFFHHNPSGHNYELKPSIVRQIKLLIMAVSVGVERTFVESFLLIVVQMLRPDPISRISSSDVCIAISELLNRSQSSYHLFGHLSVTENQLRDGREEAEAPIATFGSELLLEFQPIRFVTDRYPESGNLHLSQEQDVLCLHSHDSAGSRLVIQGDRSAMRLVPEYAFCGPGMTKFGDATLKILSKSEKDFKSICSFDLNKNIRAVTMLQEVLTGQAVVISGKIRSVKLAPKQKSGMSKRLSRNKHHSDAIGTLGRVSAVQLWRNTQHRDIATMAKIERWPRRRTSGSALQQPCYRRVVVYFENSMLIMRLAKNLRLAENSGQDDSPASATFIPTNKKVDKYFSVSLIGQTSLPLVNGELEAMEEVCRVECTSLSLEFHSIEEAKAFRNKYKFVKAKWAEDYNRLEVLQQRIGFDY